MTYFFNETFQQPKQLIFCNFLRFAFIFVYGYFVYIYVCAPHVYYTHRGQRRASDPLEMELQVVMNPCGAWGLWKSYQCSYQAFSPAPNFLKFFESEHVLDWCYLA